MVLGKTQTLKLTYQYDNFIVAGDFNVNLDSKIPMVEFVKQKPTFPYVSKS